MGGIMAKYRKKPVVVDAEQWFPDKPVEGVIPLTEAPMVNPVLIAETGYRPEQLGYIRTLEGGHIVSPGDWIITGVKGEKYPCKPDIFEATYERVDE